MNINPNNTNTSPQTALIRLTLGLLQGLALFALFQLALTTEWPKTFPILFSCVTTVIMLTPLLIISALGHFSTKTLLLWATSTAIILTLLVFYDHWRLTNLPNNFSHSTMYISPLLGAFTLIGFFIAHSMVYAGAQEKLFIASYPTYFESAWKLLIQFQFSLCFVCTLWLTLWLGVSFFHY